MPNNICQYHPIISLSIRDLNNRFSTIHRYLCYVSSALTSSSGLVVSPQASTPVAVPSTGSDFTVFTNQGATSQITFNLPTAVAGLTYTFYVQDADGLTVTASTGDTIRLAGAVTSTGGSVSSTAIGSTITLVAINSTEWVATSIVGTWS